MIGRYPIAMLVMFWDICDELKPHDGRESSKESDKSRVYLLAGRGLNKALNFASWFYGVFLIKGVGQKNCNLIFFWL